MFGSNMPATGFELGSLTVLGLVLGSFVNVVVYRVPLGLSIVRPGSFCPSCHRNVKERDNIPLLSWLLLRGRCRSCRAPISVRYPLVEAVTGTSFALIALAVGYTWWVLVPCLLATVLLTLGLMQMDRLRGNR